MTGNIECLRQKIGQCGGCGVLEIIQSNHVKVADPKTMERMAAIYCPENERPHPIENSKRSIW